MGVGRERREEAEWVEPSRDGRDPEWGGGGKNCFLCGGRGRETPREEGRKEEEDEDRVEAAAKGRKGAGGGKRKEGERGGIGTGGASGRTDGRSQQTDSHAQTQFP